MVEIFDEKAHFSTTISYAKNFTNWACTARRNPVSSAAQPVL